jgi:tripartite-type tricarboxylate transporter receptor subunit TctC
MQYVRQRNQVWTAAEAQEKIVMNLLSACRWCVILGCAALFAIEYPKNASAQDFPARPITAITSVSPGGTYDIFMRALANELRTALGQPVIIEPKPGGNNMIAARNCAEAAPNGYTICALPGDSLISDLLFKKVPYDPNKDFAAVTTLLFNTQVMAVNAELKVNNLSPRLLRQSREL